MHSSFARHLCVWSSIPGPVAGKATKAEFGLDVSFSDPLAWGQLSNVMDHELLRRMKALGTFAKDKIRFHISTGEANVNAISLMKTLISCDGYAAVLPPQVVVVVIRKRKARDNSTNPHSAFCFSGRQTNGCITHARARQRQNVYAPCWPPANLVRKHVGASGLEYVSIHLFLLVDALVM